MIKIFCCRCNQELTELGALIFSPPDSIGMVKKEHICKTCYESAPDLEGVKAGWKSPDEVIKILRDYGKSKDSRWKEWFKNFLLSPATVEMVAEWLWKNDGGMGKFTGITKLRQRAYKGQATALLKKLDGDK